MKCVCMRYPEVPCAGSTDAIWCSACTDARCVVVQWEEDGSQDHVLIDELRYM
jgi:hypothetical protein